MNFKGISSFPHHTLNYSIFIQTHGLRGFGSSVTWEAFEKDSLRLDIFDRTIYTVAW